MTSSPSFKCMFLVIYVLGSLFNCCLCAIGVSSRRPLDPDLLTSNLAAINLTSTALSKLCQRVGVHGRGWKSCSRSAEVAGVIAEAAWVGVTHCQHMMRYERWNCSLGHSRIKIMKKVFRETAFMQGVSAAAMTQVVSRACAAGRLSRCSCDDYSAARHENLHVWRWGGCGDNLKYGARFARRIMTDGKKKKNRKGGSRSRRNQLKVSPSSSSSSLISETNPTRSRDIKSHIDAHNAQVGIQVVVSATTRACKCHGVSGSCAMRTCWSQLPSFTVSAEIMKELYDAAFLVPTTNVAKVLPNSLRIRKANRRSRREIEDILGISKEIEIIEKNMISGRGLLEDEDLTSPLKLPARVKRNDNLKSRSIGSLPMSLNSLEPSRLPSKFKKKKKKRKKKQRKKKISRGRIQWDPRRLVYIDTSPNFCKKSKYSPGTEGRKCQKGENCEMLCCGSGYDTTVAQLKEPCKCRVVWCCKVQCENCTRLAEIYTCKKVDKSQHDL